MVHSNESACKKSGRLGLEKIVVIFIPNNYETNTHTQIYVYIYIYIYICAYIQIYISQKEFYDKVISLE